MSNLRDAIGVRLAGTNLTGVIEGDPAAVTAVPDAPATEPVASASPADTIPAPENSQTRPEAPATPVVEMPAPAAIETTDPLLAEIRSRFPSVQDLQPVLAMVDAAASGNNQDFHQQLHALLGDERYVDVALNFVEVNKDAIAPMFTRTEWTELAARFDPELYDDDETKSLATAARSATQELIEARAENERLKAQLQSQQQQFAVNARQGAVDHFETQVTAPLANAISGLPLPADAIARIENEVVNAIKMEFGDRLGQVRQGLLAGQSSALYGADAVKMQQRVAELTANAISYHSRLAMPSPVPAVPEKAAAAAAIAAVTEPPAAAAVPAVVATTQQPAALPNTDIDIRARMRSRFAAARANGSLG